MFSLLLLWTAGAALVAIVLAGVLHSGLAWRIATDLPNDRSLHDLPIPRVGGLVFMPIWMALAWCLAPGSHGLLAWVGLLAVISFVDDRFGLSPLVRLVTHLVAAGGAAFLLLPGSAWWILLAVLLAVVWMTNLYNFMDGANGLAGGMAALGFLFLGAIAWQSGDTELATLALTLSGCATGFLLFNFPRAKVFMGDTGSICLGFLAATCGLLGWQRDGWSGAVVALVFLPFLADASVTLFRRACRGEKVWQAHREHYYQRLILMGASHVRVACFYYLLMVGTGATAWLGAALSPVFVWVGLFGWQLCFGLIGWGVDRRWRTHQECANK